MSGKTGCSVRTNPNHIERMDQHQRTDIGHYGREWAARRLNFGRAVKERRTVSFYWSVFIVIWRPNPYGVIPFWDDPWFVPIWTKIKVTVLRKYEKVESWNAYFQFINLVKLKKKTSKILGMQPTYKYIELTPKNSFSRSTSSVTSTYSRSDLILLFYIAFMIYY